MKRIVKFRMWNKTLKQMCEVKTLSGQYAWGYPIGQGESREQVVNTAHDLNDNAVLMQFTGLHDKNGKEVYEGDVVHWLGFDSKRYQVCYDRWGIPALAGIKDCEGGDFKEFEMDYNAAPGRCEVLGNVWENPELMEAK